MARCIFGRGVNKHSSCELPRQASLLLRVVRIGATARHDFPSRKPQEPQCRVQTRNLGSSNADDFITVLLAGIAALVPAVWRTKAWPSRWSCYQAFLSNAWKDRTSEGANALVFSSVEIASLLLNCRFRALLRNPRGLCNVHGDPALRRQQHMAER